MARLKAGYTLAESGQIVAPPPRRDMIDRVRACPGCGGALGADRAICRVCEIRAAPSEPPPAAAAPAAPPRPPKPPRPAVLPLAEQLTEAEAAALASKESPLDTPPAATRRTGEERLISVTAALPPHVRAVVQERAAARGLKVGALLRQIIEAWASSEVDSLRDA